MYRKFGFGVCCAYALLQGNFARADDAVQKVNFFSCALTPESLPQEQKSAQLYLFGTYEDFVAVSLGTPVKVGLAFVQQSKQNASHSLQILEPLTLSRNSATKIYQLSGTFEGLTISAKLGTGRSPQKVVFTTKSKSETQTITGVCNTLN